MKPEYKYSAWWGKCSKCDYPHAWMRNQYVKNTVCCYCQMSKEKKEWLGIE